MHNRSQKIRLGVFLFVSFVILILIIGFFTAREFFEKSDTYYVSYEGISVRGLEVGSPVRYMGIKVGTIKDIRIDPDDVSSVIVALSIDDGTPIKSDAVADITSIGITGLKTIEITGGSNESEPLDPGSYIQAGTSMTEEITGRAEVIAEKAEMVLNNLQVFTAPENMDKFTKLAEKITMLAEQANRTIIRIDTVVTENREDVRETVASVRQISERLDETSVILYATAQKIQNTVSSDTVGEVLANVRDVTAQLNEADIKSLIDNIARVADQSKEVLIKVDRDLDRSSEDFSKSLELLKLTLENLNEASMKINEDPSILIRGMNNREIPDRELKR